MSVAKELFAASRSQTLNILNHPLQLQLATGRLPFGSFQRLVCDREMLLEGLQGALESLQSDRANLDGVMELCDDERQKHALQSAQWIAEAEVAGKTIVEPGVKCYNCGGEHLVLDCPEERSISSAALALRAVLQSSGLEGFCAVAKAYGFCCSRLLEAARDVDLPTSCYHGWLHAHATTLSSLADKCEAELDTRRVNKDDYERGLLALYAWIDSEAAAAGLKAPTTNSDDAKALARLVDALDKIEPGYAAQREKHKSFVANIVGGADAPTNVATMKEVAAAKAAAYLAAKKKKAEGGS